MKKIFIASDHAGFKLKEIIIKHLIKKKQQVVIVSSGARMQGITSEEIVARILDTVPVPDNTSGALFST